MISEIDVLYSTHALLFMYFYGFSNLSISDQMLPTNIFTIVL